jgi:hypothetical protein
MSRRTTMVKRYNDDELPTVSGGKDNNPPDRYAVVQLTKVRADNENAINLLSDQGFRFEAVLSFDQILMGNYKENK